MKRRTITAKTNAHNAQAETETKANQLLARFKSFADADVTRNEYRAAADAVLEPHFEPQDFPLPQDWHTLADTLADAGVFEEAAGSAGDDLFYRTLDLQPKRKNGHDQFGLIFWLYLNGFTNEEGTRPASAALGDGQPIEPRQAAQFYLESHVYHNGEPTLDQIDAKARNAAQAAARRQRLEQARQGCNPRISAPQLNSPQHNAEPIDNEEVIGSIAQAFDDALETAAEQIESGNKLAAMKTLATAKTNARQEMILAERQGLARPETAHQFIENLTEMIEQVHAA